MDGPKKELKKFDLVKGPEFDLGVIISDPFTAHFFDSCMASQAAGVPFDITDPKSYDRELDNMVVVYVFVPHFRGTEVIWLQNLQPAKIDRYNAYVPFDCATNHLREILSVKKFAEDLWKHAKEKNEKESRG